MKYIIFILTIILLCSCEETTTTKQKAVKRVTSNYNTAYNVVEIDGCEYIVRHNPVREHNGPKRDIISITHKGNCKYCLKRNKNN